MSVYSEGNRPATAGARLPRAVILAPDLLEALRGLAAKEELTVPALVTVLIKDGLTVWLDRH